MENKCYACAKPRPLTVEHIVPQAIGGKLKERLYCKECNETFGEALDHEISECFGWVGTILDIKRERGKVQPYEVTDVKSGTRLLCDGKEIKRKDPIVKVVSKDGKKLDFADVTARTEEELKARCASIQRRYDVPGGIKIFQDQNPGPTDTERIVVIDNSLLRRAVSKIAYGFLCIKLPRNVVLSSSFDAVRLYISESNDMNLASANYRNTGFMTDYVRPIHKIHITFNRGQGILIGFVSIFGIFRFTILLSEGFKSGLEWPDFDYTFDPVRQREVLGNENFRAPRLAKKDILRPKQSKELVQIELGKGYKALEYLPRKIFVFSVS